MATNLLILYPETPASGEILTSSSVTSTAASRHPAINVISGPRRETFKTGSSVTVSRISWDLGSGNTDNPTYLAVADIGDLLDLETSDNELSVKLLGSDSAAFDSNNVQDQYVLNYSDLVGISGKDMVSSMSLSARRYWQFNITSDDSFVHEVSKVYFGSGFDFGYEPTFNSEIRFLTPSTESNTSTRRFTLKWSGVPEDTKLSFQNLVYQYADTNPVFLWDQNDYLFGGDVLVFAQILRGDFSIRLSGTWDIEITFEELL